MCLLFGNYSTPDYIQPMMEQALIRHYKEYGIKVYLCGDQGNFNAVTKEAFYDFRQIFPDVKLIKLCTSQAGPTLDLEGFDGIYKPRLDSSLSAEEGEYYFYQHLLDVVDYAICYASGFGGIRTLYEYALERESQGGLSVYNLFGKSFVLR